MGSNIAKFSAAAAAIAVAAALPAIASAADAAAGDAAAGRTLFNRSCRSCHQVMNGAGSALGPNLAGVMGKAAPLVSDYDYSEPFKAAAAKGLVWTPETLDRFLTRPSAMIPGTKMPAAVAVAADRANIIAYMATLNGE